ncbi:MAG: hypothetical protein P8R54_02580 [Myxococcota bacterium]|nr:hypothetical protein [Myxococcota bacterium]
MSVRAVEMLPVLLLVGCQPSFDRYYSSLTDSWATQTLESAGPSITAALIIAGMTTELCRTDVTWSSLSEEGSPPLSSVLLEAMGEPEIDEISAEEDLIEVYLRDVRIMDRDQASIRLVPNRSESSYSLTAEVRDGRDGETFGSLTFTVSDGCDSSSGNAKWTDLVGVQHTIAIPADDTDIGLKFDCAYAPNDGTLQWTGELDSETRQFTTADAAEIDWNYEDGTVAADDTAVLDCERFNDVSAINWGGTVVGGLDDWSTAIAVDILHNQE